MVEHLLILKKPFQKGDTFLPWSCNNICSQIKMLYMHILVSVECFSNYYIIYQINQTTRFFDWFWSTSSCQHESQWNNRFSSNIVFTWIGENCTLISWNFIPFSFILLRQWTFQMSLKNCINNFSGGKFWSHRVWSHTGVYWSIPHLS